MSLRNILAELGHLQPPTQIVTDNSTTTAFANKTMQMKRSKSWDMHLHWLRDRETREHFNVIWERGLDNRVDYFTKHHPTVHHRIQRKNYIRDKV